MSECKCSMSIQVLGDGCRYCQPQTYIDKLSEIIDDERSEREAELAALKAKAAEPDGMALVPVEPTKEMIAAAFAGKVEAQSVPHQERSRAVMAENYKAMLAAAPAQPQSDCVMVPRAIAERMAIDAAQYEHEHAVVHDNVQLWQQPGARLTLTVGDLRTVRALLGGAA